MRLFFYFLCVGGFFIVMVLDFVWVYGWLMPFFFVRGFVEVF